MRSQIRTPLPVEYAAQVRTAIQRAVRTGNDAAEVLHSKDMLLSPAAEKNIKIKALKLLRDKLVEWEPHEMLRRKIKNGTPGTPADMYAAIVNYLDSYIEHVRKET